MILRSGKPILSEATPVLITEERLQVSPVSSNPACSPSFSWVRTEVCSAGQTHTYCGLCLPRLCPFPLPTHTPCAGRVNAAHLSLLCWEGPAFKAGVWLASGNLELQLLPPLPN